ncbi:MAG: DinB family protein [Ferruginibacter sp.]|nr:DinB family protein [Ferruginibacter sp.]
MLSKEMLSEVDGTISALMQLTDSFSQEQFNLVPFEGSWTAGELAKHMVMSNSGFTEILNGPVKDTERNPEELVEKIKTDFLNFNIKMESPAFVVPPKGNYIKEDLLNALRDIQTKIGEAIQNLDLSKTCMAFGLPGYGFLTRTEAISFILYHTKRHIHQLENIHEKIINLK